MKKIKLVISQFKINKMNCRLCDQPFSQNQGRVPRVLVSCGHTLCENCIQNSFHQSQIKCLECGQVSSGNSFTQYPVNATLISLLNQEAVCKAHNQKLQAYCEKDNQLLCLTCVINGQHKTHKISPISEKVGKDRAILRECAKSIQASAEEIMELGNNCTSQIQRLQHQYKDYLFEVGLCFNGIKSTLKELEESLLARGKSEYEKGVEKYHQSMLELGEKSKFMSELMQIYEEVMSLPNLQYLNEDNKRIFIMENCKLKKPKIQSIKIIFNKTATYTEVQSTVQELIAYEKKLQGQSTPSLKHKKTSRNNKEPTVLEVNLSEHYKKHYKSSFPAPQEKSRNSNKEKPMISIKTPKQLKQKSHSHKESIPLAVSASVEDQFNNSFQSDVYLPTSMVNSFMDSSNRSISIKGSEADFTVFSFEHQLYHFGSFNDSSVQFRRMGSNMESGKSDKQKCY